MRRSTSDGAMADGEDSECGSGTVDDVAGHGDFDSDNRRHVFGSLTRRSSPREEMVNDVALGSPSIIMQKSSDQYVSIPLPSSCLEILNAVNTTTRRRSRWVDNGGLPTHEIESDETVGHPPPEGSVHDKCSVAIRRLVAPLERPKAKTTQ